MMYPDGSFDFNDSRLIENSRGSYPLSFLPNIKKSSRGKHPKTIVFLTADANGVLPPVAKLDQDQAMFWFLMGYTSKLAGTETGIVEPVSTFSRFFGQPFMPRNPNDYASLLGEKINKHRTQVYLVNTGWSGGPYGEGKRMDINITRAIIKAVLNGELDKVGLRRGHDLSHQHPALLPRSPRRHPAAEEYLEGPRGLRSEGPQAGRGVQRPFRPRLWQQEFAGCGLPPVPGKVRLNDFRDA